MTLSLKEVEHFARLARLALSEAEKARYAAQLSSILEYAARLQSVDLTALESGDAPPASKMAPAGGDTGEGLRPDEPQPGLALDELLANAPQTRDRQFRMPPVFD